MIALIKGTPSKRKPVEIEVTVRLRVKATSMKDVRDLQALMLDIDEAPRAISGIGDLEAELVGL